MAELLCWIAGYCYLGLAVGVLYLEGQGRAADLLWCMIGWPIFVFVSGLVGITLLAQAAWEWIAE